MNKPTSECKHIKTSPWVMEPGSQPARYVRVCHYCGATTSVRLAQERDIRWMVGAFRTAVVWATMIARKGVSLFRAGRSSASLTKQDYLDE